MRPHAPSAHCPPVERPGGRPAGACARRRSHAHVLPLCTPRLGSSAANPFELSQAGPGGFLAQLLAGPLAACEGLSRAAELRRALEEAAEAARSAGAAPGSPHRRAHGSAGAAASAQAQRKRHGGALGASGGGEARGASYGIWNSLDLAPPLYQGVLRARRETCPENLSPVLIPQAAPSSWTKHRSSQRERRRRPSPPRPAAGVRAARVGNAGEPAQGGDRARAAGCGAGGRRGHRAAGRQGGGGSCWGWWWRQRQRAAGPWWWWGPSPAARLIASSPSRASSSAASSSSHRSWRAAG